MTNTALKARHQWSKDDDRTKTCKRCGMRANRFGIGRGSYTVYTVNGKASESRTVPPCAGYPADAYPLRCMRCAHCERSLHKDSPDASWRDPSGNPECEYAPNPDDGPMPGHTPGTPVVRRPV